MTSFSCVTNEESAGYEEDHINENDLYLVINIPKCLPMPLVPVQMTTLRHTTRSCVAVTQETDSF